MKRSVEDEIREINEKIESEVSRINCVVNNKISRKEFAEFKDSILEAYEDIKNDWRYLLRKDSQPKKKESNKVNIIFVVINVILIITNILIIIGGK